MQGSLSECASKPLDHATLGKRCRHRSGKHHARDALQDRMDRHRGIGSQRDQASSDRLLIRHVLQCTFLLVGVKRTEEVLRGLEVNADILKHFFPSARVEPAPWTASRRWPALEHPRCLRDLSRPSGDANNGLSRRSRRCHVRPEQVHPSKTTNDGARHGRGRVGSLHGRVGYFRRRDSPDFKTAHHFV